MEYEDTQWPCFVGYRVRCRGVAGNTRRPHSLWPETPGGFCLGHWEPFASQAGREALQFEEGHPSDATKEDQWERGQGPGDQLKGCEDSPGGGNLS